MQIMDIPIVELKSKRRVYLQLVLPALLLKSRRSRPGPSSTVIANTISPLSTRKMDRPRSKQIYSIYTALYVPCLMEIASMCTIPTSLPRTMQLVSFRQCPMLSTFGLRISLKCRAAPKPLPCISAAAYVDTIKGINYYMW